MLKILFYTFPVGHLVSDIEFERLRKGFAKADMELIRMHKDKGLYAGEHDIVMVKGFSHTWEDVKDLGKPVVYYSIGTEYKKGIDIEEANKPIKDLWLNANAVVHISGFCEDITDRVFGFRPNSDKDYVIIPACEHNLPKEYPVLQENTQLKLATTCIPRPVKRVEETERLCKKYNIELVPAYGNVDDFSYYHQCHGYIHLSRKEGMPNTVLEALAFGLPCIVTNYGGAKEAVGDAGIVIKNDYYGIWDPSDIEPIDDFLFEKAIKEFRENIEKLRMKVRERVRTVLNDRLCAEQFKQVFEKLI